jgi:Xaa-Pro aminopeptidase
MNSLERVKSDVARSELDAYMLTSAENRFYATGFRSSAGVLIVSGAGAWFLTDSRYTEAAQSAITGATVLQTDREHTYSIRINEICAEHGIARLGFEEATVTYGEYLEWKSKLKSELRPAQERISALRAVKSRDELELLIVAQRIAEKSFDEVLPLISTDITERELAAELMCRFYKNGADDKSFDPIVVSGARSSMPHGVPTDGRIQNGFLTMDFGVLKDGWCSDMTRTLCVGKPTDEMRRVYDTVLEAQLAGIAAVRAGVLGRDVDGAARSVIERAGYGEYFGHSFGHGLGIEVHESPTASAGYDKPLPRGAVISAEPGIYLPGRFGVRIEDVVYVSDVGCENITKTPKNMIIV